jgi:deazaflavin-dependent oxidoreductase (nitroreductase family)
MPNEAEKNEIDDVKGEQYIYLTTKGRKTGRSYTKELWFAYSDGKVYLSHEGSRTDWMKNLENNPNVEFKIGSKKFRAVGKLTREGDSSREKGKIALYEKYHGKASKEVIDDWFSLSTVVELVPVVS